MPSSHRGRAVTAEKTVCGERKQQVKRTCGRAVWSEQACWYPSSILSQCVHLVPFWNVCLMSSVPLCL